MVTVTCYTSHSLVRDISPPFIPHHHLSPTLQIVTLHQLPCTVHPPVACIIHPLHGRTRYTRCTSPSLRSKRRYKPLLVHFTLYSLLFRYIYHGYVTRHTLQLIQYVLYHYPLHLRRYKLQPLQITRCNSTTLCMHPLHVTR